eukprot:3716944-Amphidinium_carterae.1
MCIRDSHSTDILHQRGAAPSPACLLCGELGTELHRVLDCPHWVHRGSTLSPNTRRAVREWPMVATHGMMPRIAASVPPSCEAENGHPVQSPVWIFTDGGARHPNDVTARVAGWAFHVVAQGGATHERWGLLPTEEDPEHTVYAAELYAVVRAMQCYPGALCIYTDCKAVYDGIRAGPSRMPLNRQHLWQALWAAVPTGNARADYLVQKTFSMWPHIVAPFECRRRWHD